MDQPPPPPQPPVPLHRHLLLLSMTLLVGYLAIAFGVHHAFPFYVFDMFDSPPSHSASRVFVREADGTYTEAQDYEGWDCTVHPVPGVPEQLGRCGEFRWSKARDGDVAQWIEEHPATPGAPRRSVQLVRRIWALEKLDQPPRDCVLTTCSVNP